jgi:hypothetical protein
MINCVYYNDYIRCYRDGRIERMLKKADARGKKGDWVLCEFTPLDGYLSIRNNNKFIKIHRLIAFCFLGLQNIVGNNKTDMPDHINHIRNDNRVENLRVLTKQKNTFNKTNTKGYTWHIRQKKWQPQITLNGKTIHLGCYDTEEDARNAYLRAKEQYHII